MGCKHDFSAGLIIGGKSVEEERRRIQTTNIVIATPGRLLQHMDQTAGFNCDLLQMLGSFCIPMIYLKLVVSHQQTFYQPCIFLVKLHYIYMA